MSKGIQILCDSHHGQYIPKIMINRLVDKGWQGVEQIDIDELRDECNEWYWESWNNVENDAFFIDENGYKWQLWLNGDLFAYCEELMTEEEKQNFFEY
tara:strand:+ start:26501 stop:26794 length:294 start_codon:yes stop_codon:yes gene_type:complete